MRKKNIKHLLSFLALAGFLFLAYGSSDDKQIEQEISTQEPEISITASQLYKEYEANGVAADQKYKGKVLSVSGVVNNIDRDILDKIYVTIKGDEYFGDIQCYFAESHVNAAAQLSKGQKITVKGKCDGKLVNVKLDGCTMD
jgi:hypothetical protein